MTPEELRRLDARHVWHPFTQAQTAPEPPFIRTARGTVLVDAEGREFLDMISSWWVTLHGHAHPRIAEAIAEQARTLEHVIFAGFSHDPAVTLSKRITDLLAAPLTRVFFSDNGSTAVEVALKAALQFHRNQGNTRRTRFIAFDGGYHGDTVGAMSAGVASKFFDTFREILFPVDVLPVPATWMGDAEVEAKEAAALAALDEHLDAHGDETVAAIIEPLVQGASGMRMHRPEFLRALEQRLKAHGILLILDEVMTGFGRTGEVFAHLGAGVTPDFVCLSKGLTGGFLPLSLTVTTDAVYDAFLGESLDTAFLHGHSFTANPLGCAAALASHDLLVDDACTTRRQEIEAWHRSFLADLAHDPLVTRPRVQGTIMAFDVKVPDGSAGYASAVGPKLKQSFTEDGLLIRPLGNVVYLLPPYCVTDAELNRAGDGIRRALDRIR